MVEYRIPNFCAKFVEIRLKTVMGFNKRLGSKLISMDDVPENIDKPKDWWRSASKVCNRSCEAGRVYTKGLTCMANHSEVTTVIRFE